MVSLLLRYRLRVLTAIIGTIELISFSEIHVGWFSLSEELEQQGIFNYLCDAVSMLNNSAVFTKNNTVYRRNQIITCDEQRNTLSLVFTVSTSFQFINSLLLGIIFDKFGIRPIKLIGAFFFLAGCLCYGFISQALPWLSFVAACLISVSCVCVFYANLQVVNFFSSRQSLIVCFLNGAIDSSSVMLTLLVQSSLSLRTSFCILGAVGLLTQILTSFILLPKFKVNPDEIERLQKKNDDMNGEVKMMNLDLFESTAKDNQHADATLKKCILSRQFFFQLMWTSFLLLSTLFFINSHNIWLNMKYSSNSQARAYYSSMFGYILFGGLLAAPCAGFLVDFFKHRIKKTNLDRANSYWSNLQTIAPSMFINCVLCNLMYSLIFIQADSINYVLYVIVLFARSFVLGLNSSFMFLAFPIKYFGHIVGLNFLLAGLFSVLQYLLILLASSHGLKYAHVILLVLSFLSWLHPIQIWLGPRWKWDSGPLVGTRFDLSKPETETSHL